MVKANTPGKKTSSCCLSTFTFYSHRLYCVWRLVFYSYSSLGSSSKATACVTLYYRFICFIVYFMFIFVHLFHFNGNFFRFIRAISKTRENSKCMFHFVFRQILLLLFFFFAVQSISFIVGSFSFMRHNDILILWPNINFNLIFIAFFLSHWMFVSENHVFHIRSSTLFFYCSVHRK